MRVRARFCQRLRRAALRLSHPGSTSVDGMTEHAARAFERVGPARPASPIVLSVPHAGRDYPADLLAAARAPKSVLELLEDRLADRLIWRACAAGATAFVARAPRAEIDLNRDEREIDPALVDPPPGPGHFIPSVRARGGLGLIPSRIAGAGPIWRAPIPRAELERRIETIHRPYHEAIAATLLSARERFGAAVLLDVHSMPPRDPQSGDPPIVVGDRHGTTSALPLRAAALTTAQAFGYRAGANAPYAGGHVVARHGRPEHGVHALQLEIDRSLYLDAALGAPGPGFKTVCGFVAALVAALEATLFGEAPAIAAE
jgi:N-formylglutamate amidohydrolase